jgi:YXWGXW repeat-containing protein
MRSIRFICSCSLWLVLLTLAMPARSAQVAVAITIAPPALPVYEQPVCVGPGYIWTPGYWAWGLDDYYWVPGTWVLAPVGLLWTPGYWAWDVDDGVFVWIPGYWGPTVGFYGGIFYGFGYVGVGYEGGYWNNGAFYYNRSVNNITNVTNITNVYNKTVVNNVTVNNVSYNGGTGGTTAQPTAAEQTAARQPHTSPTAAQMQHEHAASTNRALFASVNGGKPAIAATPKPGVFSGQGVVSAKAAAPYHPTPNRGAAKPATTPGATTANKPNPNETVKAPQPPNPATPPGRATQHKPNPNETPQPAQPPKPRPNEPPANEPNKPPNEPPKKPGPPAKEKEKEKEKPPQPPEK